MASVFSSGIWLGLSHAWSGFVIPLEPGFSFCGFVPLRSDSVVSEVRNVLVKFVGVFSGLSWYLRYPRSSPWHSALLELLALVDCIGPSFTGMDFSIRMAI